MANVRLEGVARSFDTTPAVSDISFAIPDGEFWVLVGPSGCGKSTILRMIAGLEAPTAGHIFIGDRLVNQVPARLRDVAMVFQNYALYPHMTVAENLAFGLKMRQTDPRTIEQKIQAVAKSLDITHLLKRKPRQLSGGQQQRVALGRAIVRAPQVFLLDEPLSNLDAQLRNDTRAEFKQLHRQIGITTIYVTHDQTEAMTLADRIVILNRGQIQQIGTPQEIYNQPANRMVAAFLGSPPMNLFQAIYDAGSFQLGSQRLPCPAHLQPLLSSARGYRLDLGIRPEHLRLGEEREDEGPAQSSLQATVKLVEPLGRENLIYLVVTGDEQPLNLTSSADFNPAIGDRLQLSFDPRHLFVFDPSTGQVLS